MPHAQLSVTLPEGTWIRDVSTAHPTATFRVVSAMPGDDAGFALVEIEPGEEALDDIVEAMTSHPVVASLDVLQWDPEKAVVQFESRRPMLLLSARKSQTPIDLPVEIRDGTATVEFTTSRERLSAVADQFREAGISFEVEHVYRNSDEANATLNDRQRSLLEAAFERGYYDVPRRCTLTELAADVGIAKSTASERLHRIESAVVEDFLAD